jgi:hypothetical protein
MSTSAYAPSLQATVTTTKVYNVYTYAQRTLWLAYGIAIAVTTLSVAAGSIALVLNGASFSNKFSTIVRVGRAAHLTEEISGNDGDGTEPLPKHLAISRLLMRARGDKSMSSGSDESEMASQNVQETHLLTTPGDDARA